MTIIKVSTHKNTLGPRPPPNTLDLIKAATTRRQKTAAAVGTPGTPTKEFPSQICVKPITALHQTPTESHVGNEVDASRAKTTMISSGGSSNSPINSSPFRVSDTSYWMGAIKVELQQGVLPVAAAEGETGYGENVVEPQISIQKGGCETSEAACAKRTYLPRQRSLLGLNDTDTRQTTSPRAFHPKVHKLKHTLPIEVMHKAEPLRSARRGNWKYHLALWTFQREAAPQDGAAATTP